MPEPSAVCEQSGSNRQGRGSTMEQYAAEFNRHVTVVAKDAFDFYHDDLEEGVARELARINLPLGTYTEKVWWINLLNLFRFLQLRMDHHAQWEIRQYANLIGRQLIAPLFPLCWEAFEDYWLDSLTLSGPELTVLRRLLEELEAERGGRMAVTAQDLRDVQLDEWKALERCRERDECLEKFKRLGLVSEKTTPESISPALLANLASRLQEPIVS